MIPAYGSRIRLPSGRLVCRFAGPGVGVPVNSDHGKRHNRGQWAHDKDGRLDLSVDVEAPDTDVDVVVTVTPVATDAIDENGWPIGFFEWVAGSLSDLRRGSQGQFEERLPLE